MKSIECVVRRMDHRGDPPEASYTPMGVIQMVIAVLNAIFFQIGIEETADAALLHGDEAVLLAPDTIDLVKLF